MNSNQPHFGAPSPVVGVWLYRAFFTLLVVFLWTTAPAWSAIYYVSPDGDNLNNGLSLTAPFRTIQKAVDTAVAGDTVNIRGGVYRETVNLLKNGGIAGSMITVQGYNGEVPVIKGSDVVTGWTQYNATIWMKTGWTSNSQQVFVDYNNAQPGPSLQQIGMPSSLYTTFEYPKPVGSSVSSMTPGSFYYDAAASTLYVWLADGSDPNLHYMEASTRSRLFYMGKPYLYVKGLAFRHDNSSATAKQGAAVELSSYSVIDQCDIQSMSFAGLSMGYLQSNTQALNCVVSNNGDSGINAAASYNFRIAGVTMKNNNTRNFNALWHAGGFKAAGDSYGTLEFNEVSGNNGSGIWFDYCNAGNPIVVRNNYIHDNGPVEAGIFMEVSTDALVYNNIVSNNARRGIYISASDRTRVFNNTVNAISGYSAIELGGMPRSGATLTNNTISNNIISNNTAKYDLFITPANGTTIVGNSSDYNNFYRPTGSLQLYGGTLINSLSTWTTTTLFDKNSLNLNPGFAKSTPAAPADFSLLNTSQLIDKATLLAAVPQDFVKTPRPAGAAYDMGAYEYAAPVSTAQASTTDTIAPTVKLIAPSADGTTVRGAFSVSASATDNVGIVTMKLYIDGGLVYQVANASLAYSWNTNKLKKGSSHYVLVSAADKAGNLTQVSRKVIKQ